MLIRVCWFEADVWANQLSAEKRITICCFWCPFTLRVQKFNLHYSILLLWMFNCYPPIRWGAQPHFCGVNDKLSYILQLLSYSQHHSCVLSTFVGQLTRSDVPKQWVEGGGSKGLGYKHWIRREVFFFWHKIFPHFEPFICFDSTVHHSCSKYCFV